MPGYYTYLVASLPSLVFGSKAPMSPEELLSACKGLVPEADLALLKQVNLLDSCELRSFNNPALRSWADFDTALRNELVVLRAGRKKTDPSRFLRQDGSLDSYIRHAAMAAYRSTSILEAERMLDAARWYALDDASLGHYFDIDTLLVYLLKLKIMERWDNIEKADKEAALKAFTALN